MRVYTATNTNSMAHKIYRDFARHGVIEESRNGRVLRLPGVIGMTYTDHINRGNFINGRDANPFFHIMEGCWMLAGRRDVKFLKFFNSNMSLYSDDGNVFNAAYGYRLRKHFDIDQLETAVKLLHQDPSSRQVVLQIWDPKDLTKNTVDKACNLSLVLARGESDVHMTVFNRSNDAIYGGVTGANPVHFSMILQWVADQLGLYIGNLTFVSNNLHIYLDLYDKWEKIRLCKSTHYCSDHYKMGKLSEFEDFCDILAETDFEPISCLAGLSPFIKYIAFPMVNAYIVRKRKLGPYHKWLDNIKCPSLRQACYNWVNKR